MRRIALITGLSAAFMACSAASEPPNLPPPPVGAEPPPPPPPSAVPEAVMDAGAPSASAVADAPPPPPPPAACPADMKLVEGDYCTEVEQKCKKSWFDKSNKKTICEEFEPASIRCLGDKQKKRYCIDTFEWPNQKGERPEVMNRFHQAQVKCASVGKRLCTESEWTFACEGPSMKPYPYGMIRDAKKCNGDHPWDQPNMKKVAKRDAGELARLWQGVRSGSQPDCVSDFGVADLPGNADEIVAIEPTGRGKFDSVHTGGPWYKGVRNQCRPKIYTHDEDFYYYFLSFRCCAEPDQKATDPRTPRQIKEGWTLQKVEKRAQFTVDEMKKKLELKKQSKCECGGNDILCKTMCGTLLGPDAKDGTPGG